MLLRAKITFFDSNPIGRIVTRFTKDFAVLDMSMPLQLVVLTHGAFRSISVFIVICIINPWLLISCASAGALMFFF
jgi:ABC-type multidrug transport system fused ATPase/permease subunit